MGKWGRFLAKFGTAFGQTLMSARGAGSPLPLFDRCSVVSSKCSNLR